MQTIDDLIDYYMYHCEDLVPYDDPNYEQKVFDLAKHLAEAELNPDQNLTELCKYHDEDYEND